MISIKKERVLISPKDIKPSSKDLEVIGTINPGAVRLSNGDILLYIRVIEKLIKDEDNKYYYSPRMVGENKFKLKLDKFDKNLVETKSNLDFIFKDNTKRLTFISHLRRVLLDKTGFKVKSIDKKPSFFGLSWDSELGVEDPRVTKIGDSYLMTYVSLSRDENVSTSYALSNDCFRWYRRDVIFREENKDVVIFPEKVKREYVALNRPEGSFAFTLPHIWVSHSKDLEHWGESKSLILSEKDWDSGRVGAGAPPIKTEKGWLLLYHGVVEGKKLEKMFFKSNLKAEFEYFEKRVYYCVGAALLDLENPRKVIAKSKFPIIFPTKEYERGSFENKNVIFPTGIIIDANGKDLLIFSGGGDVVTSVKKVSFKEVLDAMEKVQ